MITRANSSPIAVISAFAAILLVGTWSSGATAAQAGFKKDVVPILDEHCVECHQPGAVGLEKSGLDLTSYEGLMKGTKHGPVVVPGDAFTSNLMVLIEGQADPSISMPHKAQAGPTKKDRGAIRGWIARGAKKDAFQEKVLPVFINSCVSCHKAGEVGYEVSGLDLGTYEGVMKGTKFGPVVVPGDAFISNLMVLIEGRADPSISMPHNARDEPTRWQKTLLRRWINNGARND